MVTTAVDSVFVDTNVLVYSSLQLSPLHAVAIQSLDSLRQAGIELWISRQILREYMATLTRPQATTLPSPAAAVVADVTAFQSLFHVAEDGPIVTSYLLNLLTTVPVAGKQIHDANIVATMQVYGVRRLLTHNVGDFQRFAPFIEIVPLQLTP